jgi:hypothetical protein
MGQKSLNTFGHAVNPACILPHSKQLETWKSQTLMSSRQQGTLEKNKLRLGKYIFERSFNSEFKVVNLGLFLELRPEDH